MIYSSTSVPESEQIKLLLGKLCNPKLTIRTQKEVMENLTSILKGKPMSKETFEAVGLHTEDIVDHETNTRKLVISIPKEYVSASVTEDRDKQSVTFIVTDLSTPKPKEQ